MSIQQGFNQLLGTTATLMRFSPNFEANVEAGKLKQQQKSLQQEQDVAKLNIGLASERLKTGKDLFLEAGGLDGRKSIMDGSREGQKAADVYKEAVGKEEEIARRLFELKPTQASYDNIAAVKAKLSVSNKFERMIRDKQRFAEFYNSLTEKNGGKPVPMSLATAQYQLKIAKDEKIRKGEWSKTMENLGLGGKNNG